MSNIEDTKKITEKTAKEAPSEKSLNKSTATTEGDNKPAKPKRPRVSVEAVIQAFNKNPNRGEAMVQAAIPNSAVVIANAALTRTGVQIFGEMDRVIAHIDRRSGGLNMEVKKIATDLEQAIAGLLNTASKQIATAIVSVNDLEKSPERFYEPREPSIRQNVRDSISARKKAAEPSA
jgi:hypothetical protein